MDVEKLGYVYEVLGIRVLEGLVEVCGGYVFEFYIVVLRGDEFVDLFVL